MDPWRPGRLTPAIEHNLSKGLARFSRGHEDGALTAEKPARFGGFRASLDPSPACREKESL
jgi:hypothetical protein